MIIFNEPAPHLSSFNLIQCLPHSDLNEELNELEYSSFVQLSLTWNEYSMGTNVIKNKIEYPKDIKPLNMCCCVLNDMIYIVYSLFSNDKNSFIIQFDAMKHTFNQIFELKPVGYGPSCVVVYDTIHIFGTDQCDVTPNKLHLIYSPQTNTVKMIEDTFPSKGRLQFVAVINYQNRLYRFGGYNCDFQPRVIDVFGVSNTIKKDKCDDIQWTIKENQKLPVAMYRFGYILYKKCIVTFGGKTSNNVDIDDLYALDLDALDYDDGKVHDDDNEDDNNIRWRKLKAIQCPKKSRYTAILFNSEKDILLIRGYTRDLQLNVSMDIVNGINKFYSFNNYIHLCQEKTEERYGPRPHYSISNFETWIE